jgi:hypothetical protein
MANVAGFIHSGRSILWAACRPPTEPTNVSWGSGTDDVNLWAARHGDNAQKRAFALLDSWLTPDERAQLKALDYFEVTGSAGGRYRVKRGCTNNLVRLNAAGEEVALLCVQPHNAYCFGDVMLAQKLMLQYDEHEVLVKAHSSPLGFMPTLITQVSA